MVYKTPDTFQRVFFLEGGDFSKETDSIKTQIYGTCFNLRNDIFITAGHVLKNVLNHNEKVLTVSIPGTDRFGRFEIREHEFFENFDLSLFRVDLSEMSLSAVPENFKGMSIQPFRWSTVYCDVLDDFTTFGYPFALIERKNISGYLMRAFKGHIVCANYLDNVYELSIQCPRGLSGAPLLNSNNAVVGIIVGSSISKINVYKTKETISEKNQTTIYEQDETIYFGQAIMSPVIINIHSNLLAMRIVDYLK
jgi:hypothetical protein